MTANVVLYQYKTIRPLSCELKKPITEGMTSRTHHIFVSLMAVLSLFLFSCDRKNENQSSLKLQLPVSSSNKVGALADCVSQKCLKEVVINISGPEIPIPIVNKFRAPNMEDSSELPAEVEILIPSGKERLIKLVGIFRLGEKTYVQYGQITQDIFGEVVEGVNINLGSETEFKGSRIAGRFLTGSNVGPTGLVNLTFAIPSSEFSIEFGIDYILNGWFNFDFSQNFKLTATMPDGTIIFNAKSAEDILPVGTPTVNNQVARLHNGLGTYYKYNSGTSTWNADSSGDDFVYGFFSNDASLIAAKTVCLESNASGTAINASILAASSTGTPALTYHHNNSALGHIFGIGGNIPSGSASCSNVISNDRYKSETISISRTQILQNGRDETMSMYGAFTSFITSGTILSRHDVESGYIRLRPLQGMFSGSGSGFVGGKVFRKSNANDGLGGKKPKCEANWLSTNGFSEVTNMANNPVVATAGGIEMLKFKLSNTVSAHKAEDKEGLILCPTLSGGAFHPVGAGGIYLSGAVNASISTGITGGTLASVLGSNTMTITNNGTATTTVNVNFSNTNRVGFKTAIALLNDLGSFPGFGGNCPSDRKIAPGQTCTVKFGAHTSGGSGGITINLDYHDGRSTTSTGSLPINFSSF